MMDPDLIGYALDLLEPGERAELDAYLARTPGAATELDRVRTALAPLEADREDPPAPPSLATRTIARLAALVVEDAPLAADSAGGDRSEPAVKPVPSVRPEPRAVGGRFRADLVVAAGIGLVAVGLVLSFVNRARYTNELLACQYNLQQLHQGLTAYADAHGGRFPQVGVEGYPTAETFVAALSDAGQCPPGFHPFCPAAPPPRPADVSAGNQSVAYAYPLGHRSASGVISGLWRSTDPADENDVIPIVADYPTAAFAPGAGPTSPHGPGQNVLFMGGNVRFATSSAVGVNGDDIYRNQLGRVAAGVDRVDSVLGRAGDRP